MGKVITHRFVESVQPRAARTEYPDAGCPGLYLIVQPSGTRSWAFRFRHNGVNGKRTLGSAGEDGLSLAAARAAAAAHRHRLEQGDAVTSVTSVTPKTDGGGDKIETAVASFLELHARRKNRPSTAWASERIFNRLVLPAWRGRTIDDIRKRDVIDLVESIAISGRGYLANRTLGTLSKFFNWLIARDELAVSPVTGVERPHKEKARDRTLDDAELRALWLACEGEGPFGQALRMLILTGARRNEVSHMRWSEIDEDRRLWILPRERSKNDREHVVPMSSVAWSIIESMPQFADCDYVFTADGRSPIIGWAKAKARLSAKAGVGEASWRLHDLRRTAAAGMQRLGISIPVVEKALNHQSGVFRGIVSTYQTHDYADEIRVALQRWADRVEEIVGGKLAKVITLRGVTAMTSDAPDALTLDEVLEQVLPYCDDDPFEVAKWVDDRIKKKNGLRLLSDGVVVQPYLYSQHLQIEAKVAANGASTLGVLVRQSFGSGFQRWTVERESFEVNLSSIRRSGRPLTKREWVLIDAAVYIVERGLPDPSTAEALYNELSIIHGKQFPSRALAMEALPSLVRRIKDALGN